MDRLIVVALICFCSGVIADSVTDEQKIVKLYANWREAVHTGDIPGYVAVLHPEVRMIPPGADVVEGAAHYAGFLAPVFEAATYRLEVVAPPRVTVIDDIAVAEYAYVVHLTLKDPGQAVTEAGALTASRTEARYFDVLRKNSDGNWQVWRHTWQ